MNEIFFPSIMATGFVVAFAHAAIPTHWLPFVLAGRGQRWHKGKTLMVVVLCGSGHVLFTTVLGALVVWLGIETSKWTGNVFPWIAGGALILFGLYYLIRQVRGGGHGHHHFGGDHDHGYGCSGRQNLVPSKVSRLVADRGGVDLMPQLGYRPTNKYLPPRPRDQLQETDILAPYLAPVTDEPKGFLGWLDRTLSTLPKGPL